MRISTRLGLVAGALLYAPAIAARAQVVPPPASEVPIPVKPKTDSGPDTLKIMFERLRFSNSFERRALDVIDQKHDFYQNTPIFVGPFDEFLKRQRQVIGCVWPIFVPGDLHDLPGG